MDRNTRLKCIVLGSSGAGKTSFIRRYFNKTFEGARKSTICADFYSKIIPNPLHRVEELKDDPQVKCDSSTLSKKKNREKKTKNHKKKKHKKTSSEVRQTKKRYTEYAPNHSTVGKKSTLSKTSQRVQNEFVALQMWDTAGKERLLTESAGLTSRLGDAFFRHANVAILIYDATSSRSFLQLIKWYSELLERMSRVQFGERSGHDEGTKYANVNGTGGSGTTSDEDYEHMLKRIRYCRRFPVLVVASKLDRLKEAQSKSGNIRTVMQRNVLGLQNGFKGMDYHYEYTVFHGTDVENDIPADNGDKRMSLSYGLEGCYWTNDKAYMDYVKIAEDGCFPDREMVKRWCRRNGLHHMEVSALENMGITDAVEAAVALALKEMRKQKKRELTRSNAFYVSEDGFGGNVDILNSSDKDSGIDCEDHCSFCRFLIPKFFKR